MNSSNTSNTATTPQKVGPTVDQLFRRLKHDRGAVLVEAAIAIPLLLFVILGSLEFGVAWEAKSSTTNGMRSGLLRAANLADEPQTDLRVLQSIIGEVGADDADRISWVVIFDADPANGSIDDIVDDCATAAATGGSRDHCVVYSDMTIQNVATTTDAAMFLMDNFDNGMGFDEATGVYTCQMGNLDTGGFCAGSRTVNGDIEVGVAFEYEHEWLTGILPFNEPTFREQQVTSTFAKDGTSVTSSAPLGLTTVEVGPQNFDGGLGDVSLASGGGTYDSANGTKALGRYGGGSTGVDTIDSETITVRDLARHDMICVSFDIIIEGGWEPLQGDPDGEGDKIEIDIDGDGTFDWVKDDFDVPFRAGPADRVFPVDLGCFPHTGDSGSSYSLRIQSLTNNTQEFWGIDNLVVTSSETLN